jgi:hypothetical protein
MESAECHAGINITSDKFQLVEVERHSERIRIINITEITFTRRIDFENDSESIINTVLQNAFDQIQNSLSLKTGSLSFSLPSGLFYSLQTPYDNTMVNADLVEEFRWELSVIYPFTNINNLAIQHIEIEKNPIINTSTAIILALPRKFLQVLKTFCAANRFQLKFIEASNITAERSVTFSGEKISEGISANIFITSADASLILSSGGKIVYNKYFVSDNFQNSLNFIDNELKSSGYKKINRNILSKVYLAGDKIGSEISNGLKNIVNQSPILFNPFRLISSTPNVSQNEFYTTLNNSFASAAGSAYRIAG